MIIDYFFVNVKLEIWKKMGDFKIQTIEIAAVATLLRNDRGQIAASAKKRPPRNDTCKQ